MPSNDNVDRFKRTATSVSLLRYHLVFCPKYLAKFFSLPGVEDRFKEIVAEECKLANIEILALECHIDHVHMFISLLPQQGIPWAVNQIKWTTSRKLRQEFPQPAKLPSLWTRSYFISSAVDVSAETIKKYIETQKAR